jgi:hypothetical protein
LVGNTITITVAHHCGFELDDLFEGGDDEGGFFGGGDEGFFGGDD